MIKKKKKEDCFCHSLKFVMVVVVEEETSEYKGLNPLYGRVKQFWRS